MADEEDRHERQMLLSELGSQGQQLLRQGSVMVMGCGALGSMIAQALVRAGVGRVCVADRDLVELGNLHRQVLYDEADLGRPKALVAAEKLARIDHAVRVEGRQLEIAPDSVEALVATADVVLDGTDNFETRYLVNDACVKLDRPWVYGGVVATSGLTMTIAPGRGPCLRCLFPEPGSLPAPETHGIIGTLPMLVGSLEATQALRLLLGRGRPGLLVQLDIWGPEFHQLQVERDPGCPACGQRRFDFL